MFAARMLGGCLICLAFALCGLVVGCQQKSTALNHVSGKVHFQGKLIQSGVIVFTPDATRGETGKIAIATIKNDGTYSLQTEDAVGVAAGWYRVSVSVLSGGGTSIDAPAMSVVPDKYRDPQLSLLQCEVKPNRDNHLDFNLD